MSLQSNQVLLDQEQSRFGLKKNHLSCLTNGFAENPALVSDLYFQSTVSQLNKFSADQVSSKGPCKWKVIISYDIILLFILCI